MSTLKNDTYFEKKLALNYCLKGNTVNPLKRRTHSKKFMSDLMLVNKVNLLGKRSLFPFFWKGLCIVCPPLGNFSQIFSFFFMMAPLSPILLASQKYAGLLENSAPDEPENFDNCSVSKTSEVTTSYT